MRMRAFLAMAVVAATVAVPLPATAIVNGSVATEAGPHVALAWVDSANETGTVFCSGTVIDERWVLTAAHCVDSTASGRELRVLAGAVDVSTGSAAPLSVTQEVTHPGWDPADLAYDLALLELAEATSVPPAPLAMEPVAADDEVRVWGFGMTVLEGPRGELRFADRTVYEVGAADTGAPFITTDAPNQLCFSDSGGAAMRDGILVGVHSFISPADCVPTPSSFAGHAPVLDGLEWIMGTIGVVGDDVEACEGIANALDRIPGKAGKGAVRVAELASACAADPVEPEEPVVLGASISPRPAYTTDTLTCSATGGADSLAYNWQVNGTTVGATSSLASSWFVKGDTVMCEITSGTETATDEIMIANSAPVVTWMEISPSDDGSASTEEDLTCSATGSDADGDSLAASYVWFVNGSAVATGPTLDADRTGPDTAVTCEATLFDGEDVSEPFQLDVSIF